MRVDLTNLLLGLAGVPVGISLMAAPLAFPGLESYASEFFWAGIGSSALLLGPAIFLAFKGEKKTSKLGHKRRMVALIGMAFCGVGFMGFAAAYFWPSPPSASNAAALSEDAVARLSTLGWTIKPSQGDIQFQIANASLPDMEQSAMYFKQYAKAFTLQLQSVTSLLGLHYLASVTNCTEVQINAGEFTDISELSTLTHLKSLVISQVPLNGVGIVNLTALSGLVGLINLNLNMVRTRTITPISALTGIKNLYLGNTPIADISALSGFNKLESLDISQTRVSDLTPLANDQSLKQLSIGAMQVSGLSNLRHLQNLKMLNIMDQQPINLAAVSGLQNLETLTVFAGDFPIDLAPVGNVTHLRELSISCMGMPFNRTPAVAYHAEMIGKLHDLNSLMLGGFQITDLNFLSSLQTLTKLTLTSLPISSLVFMKNLQSLQSVSMIDIPVADVSPLLALPALSNLTLIRVPARSDVIWELQRRGVIVTIY